MPNISTTDARNVYTKALAAVYRERPMVKGFLRSFFPSVEKGTKEISIEVQRGIERIAVDVTRGADGNRNKFNKSTEKIFVPPFYDEYLDVTELDVYDKLFGNGEISTNAMTNFIETVGEKVGLLKDKIDRAYELQIAQVLQTGIVTLNAGTNIDFKRKAASISVLAGADLWTAANSNPYETLKAAGEFLREKGKSQGGLFNVIMGGGALEAFLENTTVKERADIRNYGLDVIREPQRNAVGASYHGRVSAGSWSFDIWTYPEIYTTAGNVDTYYVDSNKIIVIPETPRFQLTFAAVPQLVEGVGSVTAGAYKYYDFMDERRATHDFGVKSAGVAVPVAVDQIYTAQVIA